jgi:hypothetical protein
LIGKLIASLPSYQKIISRCFNHIELTLVLKVRFPTFWNDTVENSLNLIIRKVLIGLKWRKFIKPLVDFDPPGMKLS